MGISGSQWLEENDPTRIALRTDPLTQRMRGVTVHGNIYFDAPFISLVDEAHHLPIRNDVTVEELVADTDGLLDGELLYHELYQGGCEDGMILPENIDHVLSLYKWEKYKINHDATYNEITMYDSLDQEFDQINALAQTVNVLRQSGTVLVHCQAGLNRSSLVAARSLMYLGLTADEAITQLRESRSPAVLCNPSFEKWLRNVAFSDAQAVFDEAAKNKRSNDV